MNKIKLNNIKRKISKCRKLFKKGCINITIILLFFIFKFEDNKTSKLALIPPKEIIYKGAKINKIKLLTDYFSRFSIDEQKKDKERLI